MNTTIFDGFLKFMGFSDKQAAQVRKQERENPTIQQARETVWAGSPSSREVKVAQNAIYLGVIGKAGGLNLDAARRTLVRRERFRAAKKVLDTAAAFAK